MPGAGRKQGRRAAYGTAAARRARGQLTRLNTNARMSLQRHGAGGHRATTHGGWPGEQAARGGGAHETLCKSENLDCKGRCMHDDVNPLARVALPRSLGVSR